MKTRPETVGLQQCAALMLLIGLGTVKTQENAFTSVESVAEALKLDKEISDFLKDNLKQVDEYKELVQQYLDEQQRMENEAEVLFPREKREESRDILLAGNPLIAFQAIRRIAVDIHKLSARLGTISDDLHELTERIGESKDVKVTYNEDLIGAATGLLRLQSTYHMAANDLINGKIKHLNTSSRLTISDCLLVSQVAKEMKAMDYYVEWREQAHSLCTGQATENGSDDGCSRVTEPMLMEAILEHDETRSMYLKEIAKDKNYFMKFHVFPKKLQHISAAEQRRNVIEKKLRGPISESSLCFISNELLSAEERSKLHCHYLKNPEDVFATLQRFKLEIQCRHPLVTTVYDVISSQEVDLIRKLAKPELTRSMVLEGEGAYSEFRISQTSWVSDEQHANAITKRIERITGLKTEGSNSEDLQVVNYGIGGMFSTHYDFLDAPEQVEQKLNQSDYMGNRLVTFILYLSDVELGGATSFPHGKVSVYPKKGSATMWYNLDDAGNPNYHTIHAGCPVLYGSKWIANKWILERGQLFRKPCPATNPTASN